MSVSRAISFSASLTLALWFIVQLLSQVYSGYHQIQTTRLVNVVGKDRIRGDLKSSKADPETGRRPKVWKGIRVKPEWLDESKRDRQTSLLSQETEEEERDESSYNKEQTTNTEKKMTQMTQMTPKNESKTTDV